MLKKDITTYSKALSQDMKVSIYGHYGFALMLFPSITDSHLENIDKGVIEALEKYVNKGKMRVFSISSVNNQSWLNDDISCEERSKRHLDYNTYLTDELVPLIFEQSDGPSPIITCGAAVGAFHAANTYFRRPDLFYGTIALSGTFNIEHYTKGYFDTNCYFNSPVHYLPNLNDPYWLSFLQSKHHVYLLSGSGKDEYPENTRDLCTILTSKKIPHSCDIWGEKADHSFTTWIAMLRNIFDTKL